MHPEYQQNRLSTNEYDSGRYHDNSDTDDTVSTNHKRNHENIITNCLPCSNFSGKSEIYFNNEKRHKGNGLKNLVGKAFARNKNSTIIAGDAETKYHLLNTSFCRSLTETQQHQFAHILSESQKKIFVQTRPIMSLNDIKQFYTTNKNSIFMNLPTPEVVSFENHSYVSLTSIIDHALAHGMEIDDIQIHNHDFANYNIQKISECSQAQLIAQNIKTNPYIPENTIVLYLILWSDDFEVNHTRRNKNSTWIKTVTICPPSNLTTSPIYTHPIAIGRKSDCHDNINEMINQELTALKQCHLRYFGKIDKYLPTIVETLVISADRPERTSMNKILSCKGNSSRRWRFSSLTCFDKIPSCDVCLRRRVKKLQNKLQSTRKCNRCCDWNFLSTSNANKSQYPSLFPTTKHPQSPQPPEGFDINNGKRHLRPVEITYECLKLATQFCVFNFDKKCWSKAESKTYLKVVGLSENFIDSILENRNTDANNLRNSSNDVNAIKYPALWESTMSLHQCIDTPMHLIFQGVTNSIISITTDYLKTISKWRHFGRISEDFLYSIQMNQLAFCRIDSFSGDQYTTGGWIAENYLAFSRLICIIFSEVRNICRNEVRGIDEYDCMIQSFSGMVSRLMTKKCVCIDELEDYIKLFLSSCSRFATETNVGATSDIPFWYSKANFLCLLNLPEQIKRYGPLHLYWEGSRERYIQNVKPSMKNMRTSASYLVTKMEQIQSDSLINHTLHEHFWVRQKQYNRYHHYRTYDGIDEVKLNIASKQPISAIMIKDHDAIFSLVLNQYIILYEIDFSDDYGYHYNNQWFSPISVKIDPYKVFDKKDKLNEYITQHLLMVPSINEENNNGYHVISENWCNRQQNGDFGFPKVSINLLNKLLQ